MSPQQCLRQQVSGLAGRSTLSLAMAPDRHADVTGLPSKALCTRQIPPQSSCAWLDADLPRGWWGAPGVWSGLLSNWQRPSLLLTIDTEGCRQHDFLGTSFFAPPFLFSSMDKKSIKRPTPWHWSTTAIIHFLKYYKLPSRVEKTRV